MDDHAAGRLQGQLLHQVLKEIDVSADQLWRRYVELGGVTLVDADGVPTSTAATDWVAEAVDRMQYELGERPCLPARDTVSLQRVEDPLSEERWPGWAAAAAPLGAAQATPSVHRLSDELKSTLAERQQVQAANDLIDQLPHRRAPYSCELADPRPEA